MEDITQGKVKNDPGASRSPRDSRVGNLTVRKGFNSKNRDVEDGSYAVFTGLKKEHVKK